MRHEEVLIREKKLHRYCSPTPGLLSLTTASAVVPVLDTWPFFTRIDCRRNSCAAYQFPYKSIFLTMNDLTARNFGLVIAYLIPGFIALAGVAAVSDVVRTWLGGSADGGPTIGGFLYVTLGSIAAGMTVSALRWALVDTVHHLTGLPRPKWDDSRLNEKLRAVEHLVEVHYRYYQFYANSFVALLSTYLAWSWSSNFLDTGSGYWIFVVLLAECVFFAASRDALRKYYDRMESLMGRR